MVPEYKLITETAATDITETCPIEIMSGEFKGIVYRYGQISFNEVDGGHLAVNMQVELIKSPDNFDKNTEKFTKTVGDIFVDLVETQELDSTSDLEEDVHQDPPRQTPNT